MSLESPYKIGSPVCIKEIRSTDTTSNFLTPKKSSNKKTMDRFIPSSVQSNLYQMHFQEESTCDRKSNESFHDEEVSGNEESLVFSENKNYPNLLKAQVMESSPFGTPTKFSLSGSPSYKIEPKILSFSSPKKQSKENCMENLHPISKPFLASPKKKTREIPETPYKVLDAPGLQKDFYLNLIDWSKQGLIAIGLESTAYAWSSTKLMEVCNLDEPDTICSVSWASDGISLGIGASSGQIQLFDVCRDKMLRSFESHEGRVCNLKWSGNLLASAGRDGIIAINDIRMKERAFEFEGHDSEVCGLQWSPDEANLASGANDNKVKVWNMKAGKALTSFSNHTAAVKALAWSPYKSHELVSGGGTADMNIRFWNLNTMSQTKAINTGSQICNLYFSKFDNELVSTHGYNSNQVILWDAVTMKKIVSLQGHTERIFYCSTSPCGRDIVTGAGDETLRFWKIFSENVKRKVYSSKCNPSFIDLR